jgi:hypothetical protein
MSVSLGARFQNNYKWDRNFFLLYVVMIWIGICIGFGREIVRHVQQHLPAYPLIVHFHAAAFVGWLVLLTTQVLLIRAHKVRIHRKLGLAAVILAALMIALGPATAVIVDGLHVGQPGSDPAFLSVQLSDILAFAGLVTAAVVFRNHPAAHKRLMLLATLYISDAGFARWLAGDIAAWLGEGFWATAAALYLPNDTLIVGLGVYDLITRRRFHPAYLAGVAWVLANQLTAVSLYFNPSWKPVALRLIGH